MYRYCNGDNGDGSDGDDDGDKDGSMDDYYVNIEVHIDLIPPQCTNNV